MKHLTFLSALLPFFLSGQLTAQEKYTRLLTDYRAAYVPEKVFVHTDKALYAAGENIWLSAYLVDGLTHRPDSISKVIHVELRNDRDEIIDRLRLFPNDGQAAGDFALPGELPAGTYRILAYTQFQLNGPRQTLFNQPIRVIDGIFLDAERVISPSVQLPDFQAPDTPPPTLRFFPEGGDCVTGVPCRVAVYAEGPVGNGVEVSGYLPGPDGAALTVFRTGETGFGTFTYAPRPDETQVVRLDDSAEVYSLPAPRSEGIHLNVFDTKSAFRIQLTTADATGLDGATLFVHLRGIPVMEEQLATRGGRAQLDLPKEELSPGVYVATVFSASGVAVAERIFFRAPQEEDVRIAIAADTSIYNLRDTVALSFNIPPSGDQLPEGKLSYGIVPTSVAGRGADYQRDIRTWLLLNSDIDRPVADAAHLLFGYEGRARDQRIDEIMMTRGWRRFEWEVLEEDVRLDPNYPLESGIYLRGRMVKYENPKAERPGKVFISRPENAFTEERLTDEAGNFSFGPYHFYDSLKVVLQGRYRGGRKATVSDKISIDDNPYVDFRIDDAPYFSLPPSDENEGELISPALVDRYQAISHPSLTVARNFDSLIIDLPTVDVTNSRIDPVDRERIKRTKFYSTPDYRFEVDNNSAPFNGVSVLNLLRQVPGVYVYGPPNQESVQLRGPGSILLPSPPAFFLDGIRLDADAINSIPVQQVEFIDVIKGGQSAIFGMSGGGGAILVYTRKGTYNPAINAPGAEAVILPGYYRARQFATFDPTLPANRNRPDLRTTLHWNPRLLTDQSGRGRDRLITSDQEGEYLIVAQGLTLDGRPLFGTATFTVTAATKRQ